jgi:hypothetical protein
VQTRIVYLIVGCLAFIGAVVIAVNVGWNVGSISACGAATETAAASSDGKSVLVIGVTDCGGSKKQTMARILSSTGKKYLVFLGSAESAAPILTSKWLSPQKLQLSYSPSAQLKFPTENLDGVNRFGDVEVNYKQL